MLQRSLESAKALVGFVPLWAFGAGRVVSACHQDVPVAGRYGDSPPAPVGESALLLGSVL